VSNQWKSELASDSFGIQIFWGGHGEILPSPNYAEGYGLSRSDFSSAVDAQNSVSSKLLVR
jgi:hypothetical protein